MSENPPLAASAAPRSETLNTRAAGIVGLAVMCSRVLGLAREQIFAALFGGGAMMDAFTIAFRIPNLLRDLFAEGALSTAFITIFSKTISREGDVAAFRLANKVTTLTLVALSSITVLGIIFAPWIIGVLAPGFDPDKQALTVTLARIMYPFILMVSLAALVMGMLNARNVFGIPAMASSFFNLGSIAAGVVLGWIFDPHFGPRALLGLALGTLVGGLLQLGMQLPALRREGFVFRPDLAWRDRGVSAVLQLMVPSVIAASSTQVNVMVNSVFASHLGNGPTYWLSIAFRLMQLPLGIFGVALGTVSLPLLARLAVAGNRDGFRTELARGIRLAFLMTIPATVGLIVLAEPIVSVLYQHGRFTAYQAHEAAGDLQYYALGLIGYASLKVLVNAFYAIDRRKTPMFVSFAAIGLNLLFNWFFTWHLRWGHRGLAFSTACIASINFIVLFILMRRELGRFHSGALGSLTLRVGLAAAVMAAVCLASMQWLLPGWQATGFWLRLAWLMATIVVATAAFSVCASLLKVSELTAITAAFKRRLNRAKAR
ncbi:MAG TPA: murein biosynthesis integral membrane protein MurJ [Steroidobacteraceae bacterium]|nr:murein biosynthesis integral membrane protein MurJ [Steroidobacteraceae bacterium]